MISSRSLLVIRRFAIRSLVTLMLICVGVPLVQAQDRRIQRVKEDKYATDSPRRFALVVGNDAYRRSPLLNAVNDARGMRQVLSGMGFFVDTVTDVDYPTLDRAIDLFVDRLRPGDIGLFYYAGHGVQVEGENYLIPVDFDRARVAKVKYRAVPANLVRERMEQSGARLAILVLDACRDNPFSGNRSVGPGLAQMDTGIGTFIAFSTAPGRTAADNPSASHGLFTQYLIRTLETPGLSIDEVFNEVRREVYRASNGQQIPWTASSLIGSFYFRPAERPKLDIAVQRREATGSLDVTVNQGDAEIHLDDERIAISSGAETLRLEKIPIGNYTVRVRKSAHQDIVHNVRIEPGGTVQLQAWFPDQPLQIVDRPEIPGLQAPRPEASRPVLPRPRTDEVAPSSYSAYMTDDFCDTLEQVLMACPGQFRDIVTPSRSLTRTFLEPTVSLPGAWYSKVHRASSDSFEYLSSFEADLAASPGGRLQAFVSRVESCLPEEAIAWHQRRSTCHQLQVDLAPGTCQLEIAVRDDSVDLEIYRER